MAKHRWTADSGLVHPEVMPRTAFVAAHGPHTHRNGSGPSAAGPAVCRATGARLTRRRVVDFGRTGAMRCR